MNPTSGHRTEEKLIAYQLQESSDAAMIAEHLEVCTECAAVSSSIAETLRVFSAEPVPQANLDHAWQRLRGSLPALTGPSRRRASRRVWSMPLTWMMAVAAIVLVTGVTLHLRPTAAPMVARQPAVRPGPLTDRPTGEREPALNDHLDSAERLLTEVNHASGPLDETVRAQAHTLLLTNAVYVQQANTSGDLAQAALLENLGRVLTTLDHQQASTQKGWHVRFEMNTDGLLLDLRILQQNDHPQDKKDTQ